MVYRLRSGMGGITALKRIISKGQPNDADLWFIMNAPFSFQLIRWIKIVEFLRHEYFKRMWMIQEVALSKKLTMIHGNERNRLDRVCIHSPLSRRTKGRALPS